MREAIDRGADDERLPFSTTREALQPAVSTTKRIKNAATSRPAERDAGRLRRLGDWNDRTVPMPIMIAA
jgi:hypothetical protein